jgi:hypothetical protein
MKKFKSVRSGEGGGHAIGPPFLVRRSGKFTFETLMGNVRKMNRCTVQLIKIVVVVLVVATAELAEDHNFSTCKEMDCL